MRFFSAALSHFSSSFKNTCMDASGSKARRSISKATGVTGVPTEGSIPTAANVHVKGGTSDAATAVENSSDGAVAKGMMGR